MVGDPWDGLVPDSYPRLKAVAMTQSPEVSVGLDSTGTHNVTVCVGQVTEAERIADQGLSLLLASFRDLLELDATVRRGDWRPDKLANDLHRARVAVVGRGAAAHEIALRLAGFECDIVLIDREGIYGEPPPKGRDEASSRSSEDLPEPLTPVTTVIWLIGMEKETFLRLLTRAPLT